MGEEDSPEGAGERAPFFVVYRGGSVAMPPLSLDATSIFLLCCVLDV